MNNENPVNHTLFTDDPSNTEDNVEIPVVPRRNIPFDPVEPNEDAAIIDNLLADDYFLHSSKELKRGTAQDTASESISSTIPPKGMTEDHFKKFAFFIFKHFNTSDGNIYLGGQSPYQPPQYVYFKGSSVTCLKYANEQAPNGIKIFDSSSDYDVGFVSPEAINAMKILKMKLESVNNDLDVTLANKLAALCSKIDPGPTNYLDIHNKDKNSDSANDPEKRRFFPDGTPHIKFCEALNRFVKNDHPFNFVMINSLNELKFQTKLVSDETMIQSIKWKDILNRCNERIQKLPIGMEIKTQLHRPVEKNYDHMRPVLVYTWDHIKRYHDLFCQEFPDDAEAAEPIFEALRQDRIEQRDSSREPLLKAKSTKKPSAPRSPGLFTSNLSSSGSGNETQGRVRKRSRM